MDNPTDIFSETTTKEALGEIVDLVFSRLVDKGRRQVRNARARIDIPKAAEALEEVRWVKTIWQTDRKVDLLQFYCHTRVSWKDGWTSKDKPIRRLIDFPDIDSLLVVGVAGQGKSTFLRYLTLSTLQRGLGFPLFVELRHLRDAGSFDELIEQSLSRHGLEFNLDTLIDISESGNVILFLDAFDEVPEDLHMKVIADIESAIRRADGGLRVIMSARPGTGAEFSPSFRTVRIAPLSPEGAKRMVNVMVEDPATAEELCKGISIEPLLGLLSTPLMVTLLVVHYGAERSLPATEIAFYSDLFMLLLRRHDKTKPGFIRERKCALGDSELHKVFCAVSLLSAQQVKLSFREYEFYRCIDRASDHAIGGVRSDASMVADDICRVTCLIMKEGGVFSYAHKTVQEYHAALCIQHQKSPESKREIYRKLRADLGKWREVLRFLRMIDSYFYMTLFEEPVLNELLDVARSDSDSIAHGFYFEISDGVLEKVNASRAHDFIRCRIVMLLANSSYDIMDRLYQVLNDAAAHVEGEYSGGVAGGDREIFGPSLGAYLDSVEEAIRLSLFEVRSEIRSLDGASII